jgi:hypothetical protein
VIIIPLKRCDFDGAGVTEQCITDLELRDLDPLAVDEERVCARDAKRAIDDIVPAFN